MPHVVLLSVGGQWVRLCPCRTGAAVLAADFLPKVFPVAYNRAEKGTMLKEMVYTNMHPDPNWQPRSLIALLVW